MDLTWKIWMAWDITSKTWMEWTMVMSQMKEYVTNFSIFQYPLNILSLYQSGDDSLNFDQDPAFAHLPALDKMRKVRREVLKTINEFRKHANLNSIYTDQFTNLAANEYARFLITEEPNDDSLQQICESFKIVGDAQKAIIGFAYLDDDNSSNDNTKQAEFLDAHGLLLELQDDLAVLMNPAYSHVGIGFAASNSVVKIVELLSSRPIMVSTLNQLEGGEVQLEGMVIDNSKGGIYGGKIVSAANLDKAVVNAGPYDINYDKDTGKFIMTFEGVNEEVFNAPDPKILEVYFRTQAVDKIVYGDKSMKKLTVRDFQSLNCVMRVPMEYIPDPRVVKEDEQDQEKLERDMKERAERAAEEKKIREAQEAAKKEEKERKRQARLEAKEAEKKGGDEDGSDFEDGESGEGESDSQEGRASSNRKGKSGSVGRTASKGKSLIGSDEDAEDFDEDGSDEEGYDNAIGDLPSQPVMKRELIQAIHDEMHEYNELKRQNEEFQKEIILMEYTGKEPEKQTDQMLHEHKYLNTLANVH